MLDVLSDIYNYEESNYSETYAINTQLSKDLDIYNKKYIKFYKKQKDKNKSFFREPKKIYDRTFLLCSGIEILQHFYQQSKSNYSKYENKTIFSTDTHGDMMAFLYSGIVSGAYIFKEGEPLIKPYNTATGRFLESMDDINKGNIKNIIFLPNVHINPNFRGTYVSGGDDIDRGMHSEEVGNLKLNLIEELKEINKQKEEVGEEKLKIWYLTGNHEDMLVRGVRGNEIINYLSFENGFKTFLWEHPKEESGNIIGKQVEKIFSNLSERYRNAIKNGDMKTYTLLDNGMVAGHTIMNKSKIHKIYKCFQQLYLSMGEENFNDLIADSQFSSGKNFYSILKEKKISKLLGGDINFTKEDKKDLVDFVNHISSNIDGILRYKIRKDFRDLPCFPIIKKGVNSLKNYFKDKNPILWTRYTDINKNENENRISSIGFIVGHDALEGDMYDINTMMRDGKEDIILADVKQSHASRKGKESLAFFTILDNNSDNYIDYQRMFFEINNNLYIISSKNFLYFNNKRKNLLKETSIDNLQDTKTTTEFHSAIIPVGFSNLSTKERGGRKGGKKKRHRSVIL